MKIKNTNPIYDPVFNNLVGENKDEAILLRDQLIASQDKILASKDKYIGSQDKVIENQEKIIETQKQKIDLLENWIKAIAIAMIGKGLAVDEISKMTRLSVEEINKFAENI